MPSDTQNVLVVLTTGKQDRGTRATLAFSWACTALAMGKEAAVYRTMEGTIWAMCDVAKGIQVDGFEPLSEYIDQFLALGGELLVCAPCTEYYCSFDRNLVKDRILPEATIVGLTTVVAKTTPNSTVVTF